MSFLEMRNVCKGFGKPARAVLTDVNLSIARGEFVAIVGYSGAGKTTLLSLLAGLAMPDRGQCLFDGQPITGPGAERGVVFQNYSLLPWMSVFDNLMLAVDQVFPQFSPQRKRDHVRRYIDMVNLSHAADRKPAQLSGGMRQRVSVARALAMDPEALLMDEPLSALDALTRSTLQDEIGRIWERDKKTVVLITNDVFEGVLLADRIIPLTAGPGATLGPSIAIDLPRPRNRETIEQTPQYKAVFKQVIEFLQKSKTKRAA